MGGSEHTLVVLGGKKKSQSHSVTMIKEKVGAGSSQHPFYW